MITEPDFKLTRLLDKNYEMEKMLKTVLETFGRTDGVCVTTQTKQHVLQNIRELLETIDHG